MTDIVIELLFEELPASEQRRLNDYFVKNWLTAVEDEKNQKGDEDRRADGEEKKKDGEDRKKDGETESNKHGEKDSKGEADGTVAESKNNGKKKILIGPRRVALLGFGIDDSHLQKTELKKGPRTNAPKEILAKFLSANGLQEKDLKIDGDYYFYEKTTDVASWLATTLADKNLFSKTMVWQTANDDNAKGQAGQWRAIRPLRRIVIQVDDKPRSGDIAWSGRSMELGQEFVGHRFLSQKSFSLNHAKNYETSMKEKFVRFANNDDDWQNIQSEFLNLLAKDNLEIGTDDMNFLRYEVMPLVEYPYPMLGKIDDAFMELPQEIIISTIKTHQKFVPLYDKASNVFSPYFLIIANNSGDEETKKEILAGYQRVLYARLADAKYFLAEDLKHDLNYFRDKLKNRLFFQGLGTVYDKTERIKNIALQYKKYFGVDNDDEIKMAAEFSKADLTTQIVNEMPELQGIMGGYYATQQKLPPAIATALANLYHYHHGRATDLSALLGFADRLDNLIEFFRIGKMPTGSSDPFALRRAALGIIEIISKRNLAIDFSQLDLSPALKEFLQERFLYSLATHQGLNPLIISIIKKQLANKPLPALLTLGAEMKNIDLSVITALTKRALNIVEKKYQMVDESNLQETAEKKFHEEIKKLENNLATALKTDDMLLALNHIAAMGLPLNDFFENILINDKDDSKKQNRHALLNKFLSLTNQVADFSLA